MHARSLSLSVFVTGLLLLVAACGDGGGGGGSNDALVSFANASQSRQNADVELDSKKIATLTAGTSKTVKVSPGMHDVAFYVAGTRLPMCLPTRREAFSGATLFLTCDDSSIGNGCAPPDGGGSRLLVANGSTVNYDVWIDGQRRGGVSSRAAQVFSVNPGSHPLAIYFAGTTVPACAPRTFEVGAGVICGLSCSNSNAPGIFEFRNDSAQNRSHDVYVGRSFVGRISRGQSLEKAVVPGSYLIEFFFAGTTTPACQPANFSVGSGQRQILTCRG